MSPIRCASLIALIFASVLLLSVPNQAFAGPLTEFFLIDRLETDSEAAGFKIVPEGAVENPHGCASATAYHSVDGTTGNSQRLSIALVAIAAGREARVWVFGCSAEGLPKVWRVDVQ